MSDGQSTLGILNQPFVFPKIAQTAPTFSTGPIPRWLDHSLSPDIPGVMPRPTKEMSPAELIEHEREHERGKLRDWIESARRSIDPSQKNADHEAAVAEHIAWLESQLAELG